MKEQKKTGMMMLKEKFGIPAKTQTREAINDIIRGHVAGGEIILDAIAKLVRIQHGNPSNPLLVELTADLTAARDQMAELVLSWASKKSIM